MTVSAVLLDLDGTLVDTAPDLVAVLNRMLQADGRPPMPFAIARNVVSNGAVGLIKLGFGDDCEADQIEELRQRFIQLYQEQVCIKSRLFIDIHSILSTSHDMRVPWGIVTNKPHAMTEPLLEQLGIEDQPACVISGDRLPQRKPHPAPLQLAAAELGLSGAQCVYIGDALRDIQAGRAAGMRTIVAGYGYIRPCEDPGEWGADLMVRRPDEVLHALRSLNTIG